MTDCAFCGSDEHSEHNCSLSYLARQAEALERIALALEVIAPQYTVEIKSGNVHIDRHLAEATAEYHQSFKRAAFGV